MRLLVPLWNPPEGVHAGGFYRAKRMLETFSTQFEVTAIKNDTFDLNMASTFSYPARHLQGRGKGIFQVMRVVNWVWSTIAIIAIAAFTKNEFDVVYVPTSEILPVSLAGWLIGRLKKIPVVFCNLNVRDTEFWQLNRWLHKRVAGIITLSRSLSTELSDESIDVPILIGSCGVDDLSLPKESPRYDAIFVGRQTAAKGIIDLIEIWNHVCTVLNGARLLILGAHSIQSRDVVAAKIRAYKLSENITIVDDATDAEKWKYYSASRICVFPSHVEGWGIVPIEAHLAGLPVVAYDLEAYAETIRSSPTAILVTLGDTATFAQRVLDLLKSATPDTEGRAWALQFSWERAAALESTLLETIVKTYKGCMTPIR